MFANFSNRRFPDLTFCSSRAGSLPWLKEYGSRNGQPIDEGCTLMARVNEVSYSTG